MELGKCIIDSPNNIRINNLYKAYDMPNDRLEVLKGLDLKVEQGEMIAIMGQSGAGKSTLLHIIGALDRPTSGSVHFGDLNLFKLGRGPLADYRRSSIGFIFQFHNLLPEFSALENVMMPLVLAQKSIAYAKDEANKLLTKVGLGARLHHKPAELSGGERQRVAIARALVHKPFCVLADEPTGNLDNQTARVVFDLMQQLNQEFNTALVIVTHDQHLAKRLNTAFTIQNGRLVAQNS